MRRIPGLISGLVLLTLVGISYGASLRGGFVWDDRPLIVENGLLRDPGRLGTLLTTSFWQTGDRHDRFRSFFRPVVSASYALDSDVWGLHAFGFRLTNLLLHLLCCWLVYRISTGEGLGVQASLAGAALFAVHPVHAESVAWISGRTDLVCAAFFLGAFAAHRRAAGTERSLGWRSFSLLLFALALFSKEMAATLPAIIALDAWVAGSDRKGRLRTSLVAALPYLCVFAVYMVARHHVLGGGAEPLYRLSIIERMATASFVLARYVTLLLLPIGLEPHYPYDPLTTFASPIGLLSVAVLAVVGGAAWRLKRTSEASCFWLLWIFIGLLPVLAFGSFGDVVMADRFLYLPSVGLCLLLARWVALVGRRRPGVVLGRLLAATVAAGVMGLALASSAQSRLWLDDLGLFSHMVLTSPDSAMVRCNLGLSYYHRGEFARAIQDLNAAIKLAPGYAMAHNNLAAAFERQGRTFEALRHYQDSLRYAPALLESRVNMASLLVRLGRSEEGLGMLRDTVERYPRYTEALYAYAEALDRTGHRGWALPWLERALAADPLYPNTHYMLGKIAYERGDKAQAVARMRRFLELWPEPGPYADAARRVITLAEAPPASRTPTSGKAEDLGGEGGPSVASR